MENGLAPKLTSLPDSVQSFSQPSLKSLMQKHPSVAWSYRCTMERPNRIKKSFHLKAATLILATPLKKINLDVERPLLDK